MSILKTGKRKKIRNRKVYNRIEKLLHIKESNVFRMCKNISVHRGKLSAFKHNKGYLFMSELEEIAKYLGVDADCLISGKQFKEAEKEAYKDKINDAKRKIEKIELGKFYKNKIN